MAVSKRRDPIIEAVCKVLRINPDTVHEVTLEPRRTYGDAPDRMFITIQHDVGESYHVVKGRQFKRLKRELLRAERLVKKREHVERMAGLASDTASAAVRMLREIGRRRIEELGLGAERRKGLEERGNKAWAAFVELLSYVRGLEREE